MIAYCLKITIISLIKKAAEQNGKFDPLGFMTG
jgi:hypothetical protein